MFSPNEPCSRIRAFQAKMQEDLRMLQGEPFKWTRKVLDAEADLAMMQMLEWEEQQCALRQNTDPKTKQS